MREQKIPVGAPQSLIGWTFFDPANLICLLLLISAASLVVLAMRTRGAPDWQMPLGLYLSLLIFLRGYIFSYYYGRTLSRILVYTILIFGLLSSAVLWEDRASAYELLRASGPVQVRAAPGFHIAALLHALCTLLLSLHLLMPRRWLIRVTDELADRGGQGEAQDAPPEEIDDEALRAGDM